jgi:uroporphyrinogen decarboxylase
MTHRERILRTLRFEDTDRVAYDLMESAVWPELMAYFRDQHHLDTPEAVWDFLDVDCRWGLLQYHAPEAPPEPVTNNVTPGGQVVAPARDYPVYSQLVSDGPLADAHSPAEVAAYPLTDPAHWQLPDLAAMRERWPDRALVYCPTWTLALFWTACAAFGMEGALIKMHTEPQVFDALVRRQHERGLEILARTLPQVQGVCDVCWLGDDFSGQQALMMNPALWRQLIKPHLAEQVALVRQHGLPVLYHSCGAVREVLGDLADIGVNALLVFQTTAAGMDPESIARDFGGRLAFYGGIDVQQLLSFGTPADVAAAVQRNVAAFADCGGYIVSNAHCSSSTIKGENLVAMCEAARRLPGSRSGR